MLIALKMSSEKDYSFTSEAGAKLKQIIQDEKDLRIHFSNARYVRNVIEKAIRHQAVRLMKRREKMSRQNLMEITARDIESQLTEAKKVEGVYNL